MRNILKIPKYPVILVGIAALVLVAGVVFKPKTDETQPASERDLARLQVLAQRKRLDEIGSYLSQVAQKVSPELVYLPQLDRSGLIWKDDRRIITSWLGNGRISRAEVRLFGGQMSQSGVCPVPAGSTFGCLELSSGGILASEGVTIARATPAAGQWVLAVAAGNDPAIRFSQGLYQGVAKISCSGREYVELKSSAPIDASLMGGGVFNLDADLLGVVIECGGRYVAVTANSFESILNTKVAPSREIEEQFGFRPVEDNDEKTKGVPIAVVWSDSVADAADIEPGDVLLSVGGREVNSVDDLGALLLGPAANTTAELKLLRVRKKVTAQLSEPKPDATPAPERRTQSFPTGFVVADGSRTGQLVKQVEPDSEAAKLGLRPGDRLISDPELLLKASKSRGRVPVIFEFARQFQTAKAVLRL